MAHGPFFPRPWWSQLNSGIYPPSRVHNQPIGSGTTMFLRSRGAVWVAEPAGFVPSTLLRQRTADWAVEHKEIRVWLKIFMINTEFGFPVTHRRGDDCHQTFGGYYQCRAVAFPSHVSCESYEHSMEKETQLATKMVGPAQASLA